jgi:adenosylcobinamide kinase/adenosylcobinamide-phosphate guanylyltransferase
MSCFALVGGGVRSGKSAFALRWALSRGTRRSFVATAEAFDAEMQARIDAHQAERGVAFTTVEAPRELEAALTSLVTAATSADVIVVDCLTLWLSNLLLEDSTADAVAQRVEALASILEERRAAIIVVSNEVGMGVVPESALGRAFRDVTGRAHQRLARNADELYLAALGCIVRLKPAPLGLQEAGATP